MMGSVTLFCWGTVQDQRQLQNVTFLGWRVSKSAQNCPKCHIYLLMIHLMKHFCPDWSGLSSRPKGSLTSLMTMKMMPWLWKKTDLKSVKQIWNILDRHDRQRPHQNTKWWAPCPIKLHRPKVLVFTKAHNIQSALPSVFKNKGELNLIAGCWFHIIFSSVCWLWCIFWLNFLNVLWFVGFRYIPEKQDILPEFHEHSFWILYVTAETQAYSKLSLVCS